MLRNIILPHKTNKYDEKIKLKLYNRLVLQLVVGTSEKATYGGADRKDHFKHRKVHPSRCQLSENPSSTAKPNSKFIHTCNATIYETRTHTPVSTE